MLEDPKRFVQDFNTALTARQQINLANAQRPLYEAQAQQARQLAATADADMFNRYGAEIDNIVNKIPVEQRTSDMYKEVTRYVKGLHVDELVEERSKELAATYQQVEDVTYSTPEGSVRASDNVWDKLGATDFGKRLIDTVGKQGIIAHCEKSGTPLKEYVEQATKTNVRFSAKGGWDRNIVE